MDEVILAEYLWTRLHQLGVKSLHGVPGDFNLVALDYVEKAGLTWVGNCTELEAGYAADGYARASGKLGAMTSVIGVGELSAINACAGSYAEYVPVVYIVGTPPMGAQKNKLALHHTLGNGDFDVFANMFKAVTVAQANLNDPRTAATEIDRVLRECWIQKRPVYIRLPTCMVNFKLPRSRLEISVDLELPVNDIEIEDYIVTSILELLYKARRPVILSDVGVARHQVITETNQFVLKSEIPTFVTPMGKSSIDESLPNFCGLYVGNKTKMEIKEYVESADFCLNIGSMRTDINTGFFTTKFPRLTTVELYHNRAEISGAVYPEIHMKNILKKLSLELDTSRLRAMDRPLILESPATPPESPQRAPPSLKRGHDEMEEILDDDELILHDYLWPRMSDWFQPNDIIITENGTSNLGVLDCTFPEGAKTIAQTLWGSIGYTLPAAQGASMAVRDFNINARTILFIGDGSFQLTSQSLSTIISHNLNLTIFLIANEGYTIERFIHGWKATYNDIVEWDWKAFPSVMAPRPKSSKKNKNENENENEKSSKKFHVYECENRMDLEDFLARSGAPGDEGGLDFVVLRMPKEDAPRLCKEFAAAAADSNKRARLS